MSLNANTWFKFTSLLLLWKIFTRTVISLILTLEACKLDYGFKAPGFLLSLSNPTPSLLLFHIPEEINSISKASNMDISFQNCLAWTMLLSFKQFYPHHSVFKAMTIVVIPQLSNGRSWRSGPNSCHLLPPNWKFQWGPVTYSSQVSGTQKLCLRSRVDSYSCMLNIGNRI